MYAINVIDKLSDIREFLIKDILDLEYKPKKNSYYIGYGGGKIKNKLPKFLNWYDDIYYINIWNSKEEASEYLELLLNKANKYYKTKNDPFNHLVKTKGDWKNYIFKICEINPN